MNRIWLKLGGIILALVLVLYILSGNTDRVATDELTGLKANVGNGELVFHIGGCASCHRTEGTEAESNTQEMGGGERFETEFGTFVAPNLSPDSETGIGNWSASDFATALLHGVSPQDTHYYPAFPYTSYTRMTLQDVVDLKAYLDTLPPVSKANEPHQLKFPYSIRRGIGLWKLRYLNDAPIVEFPTASAELKRGQYLVEALGHCGECHTPRDFAGGLNQNRWLAGGPDPDGKGKIPNITPHKTGIEEWELIDISGYLSSGFTPDYDVVGGSMADVVDNTAKLSDEDRHAIALYLKAITPIAKIKKD